MYEKSKVIFILILYLWSGFRKRNWEISISFTLFTLRRHKCLRIHKEKTTFFPSFQHSTFNFFKLEKRAIAKTYLYVNVTSSDNSIHVSHITSWKRIRERIKFEHVIIWTRDFSLFHSRQSSTNQLLMYEYIALCVPSQQ